MQRIFRDHFDAIPVSGACHPHHAAADPAQNTTLTGERRTEATGIEEEADVMRKAVGEGFGCPGVQVVQELSLSVSPNNLRT